MSASDEDRTASLMTPAKLAQMKARPAVASPAAWLDQMAADAGSGHVRRLAELRQQLEAALRGREADFATVARSCDALHDALGKLDYALLQPKGWLARATGKGKEAAATFVAGHDRMHRAAEDLVDEVRVLQKKQSAQGPALERSLVEVGTEVRAIEKIMEQGTRWLQDMRNQLKERQAQAGEPAVAQQIAQDNARCELLVARLKVLRAVTTAAQQAVERCKAATARRVSAVAGLQQVIDTEWKAAAPRLEALAEASGAGRSAPEGVDEARRAAGTLQAALKQAAEDCATLPAQEQAAADELAALQVPLQAAA